MNFSQIKLIDGTRWFKIIKLIHRVEKKNIKKINIICNIDFESLMWSHEYVSIDIETKSKKIYCVWL